MLVSDRRQLAQLPDLPYHLVSSPTSIREPLVALAVRRFAPDVVFSPMQTMGSWGRRYRLVLTLHDLIYYDHPTPPAEFAAPIRLLWRAYHLAWWPQRLLLNRADAVVTVSETTAELIAAHRLTDRPVTVVPERGRSGAGRRAGPAHRGAGLHGLVHAVQERGHAGPGDERAAGARAAPDERDHARPSGPG